MSRTLSKRTTHNGTFISLNYDLDVSGELYKSDWERRFGFACERDPEIGIPCLSSVLGILFYSSWHRPWSKRQVEHSRIRCQKTGDTERSLTIRQISA
jgi:hypothetical protein